MNLSGNSTASSLITPVDTALMLVHIVIILTVVVGNSLIIAVVKTTPSMYTTTNFLLVSVSVADLLTVIWLIPADGLSFLEQPGGSTSDFLCRFLTYNSLPKLTAAISGMTFTLISVERYHAILKPLRAGLRLTTENVRYVIAGIWVFWLVMLLPFVIFIKYDDNQQKCIEKWSSSVFMDVFLSVLSLIFLALLGTMMFCYFNLIKDLYFTKSIVPASAVTNEEKKSKRKLVKLLILITAAYLFCFAPYISTFVQFAFLNVYDPSAHNIVVTMLYSNSCVNPVICAFQSSNYREGFRRILCGCKRRRDGQVENLSREQTQR
jgi:hypothetical protein